MIYHHFENTSAPIECGALLMIDLERSKNEINQFDKTISDIVIKVAADRIRTCLEATHWLARYGDDVFAVFIPHTKREKNLHNLSKNISNTLGAPFHMSSKFFQINASIGVRFINYALDNPDQVMKDADSALHLAKEKRDSYVLFNPEVDQVPSREAQIEQLLPQAISRKELELFYHPKVDVHNESVVGLEALLRWNSKELGLVTPEEFIPIAETCGQISSIGEWVLDTVCGQIKKWRIEGKGDVVVSVNVSMQQFQVKYLNQRFEQIITKHQIPPSLIELELTESVFMSDPYHTVKLIQSLKNFGVRISLDDFGTGFSSLGYLKNLPLDMLKLDRTFIHNINSDDKDKVIVQSIIQIAHSLGIKVVVEGVERLEQLELLRVLGCDVVQGYLFYKPMPPQQCETILFGT